MSTQPEALPVVAWCTENGGYTEDQQRAEQRNCSGQSPPYRKVTWHDAATARIAELEQQLAQAQKDARRWRFYDENALHDWHGRQLGEWLHRLAVWDHGSRNAAIDIVMAHVAALSSSAEESK